MRRISGWLAFGLLLVAAACRKDAPPEGSGASGTEDPHARPQPSALDLPGGLTASRALTTLGCELGQPPTVGADGKRRLALLVGVGDYQSETIPDLRGPPEDVQAMYSLLTDPQTGYGFAPQDVCVLRDGEATLEAVQRAFEEALVARAQPGDVAVFYYSGHGTQVADRSRDEADERDEAFLLHDSWTAGVGTLLDDTMNTMLSRLHAKTDHVVVLLDACTSGGLTRDLGARVKQVVPVDPPEEPAQAAGGDGAYLAGDSLPGLVVLSAARDGSLALEPPQGGLGYFTAALVAVLGQSDGPMTWAQVGRLLPRQIEQLTDRQQFPLAQGALDREVFGGGRTARPMAWEVVQAGDTVRLEGVSLPGWGVGAELRLYPGASRATELSDATKARATVILTAYDGVRAEGRLLGTGQVAVGDLAVLSSPAPGAFRLGVTVAKEVPASLRKVIEGVFTGDDEARGMLELRESAAFELALSPEGALRLRGPEGLTRNVLPADAAALPAALRQTLLNHARQQALLAARGAGGGLLYDDRTVQLRVVQAGDQPACARPGWVQACPGETQQLPLCSRWRVEVRNTHPSETLRVGGAVLSSDGRILPMPSDGRALELPANSAWVPLEAGQTYTAIPPFGAVEDIVVFGTLRDTHINWSVLAADDPVRPGGKDLGTPLEAQIARLMTGGTRAVAATKAAVNPWTVTHLPIRAVANLVVREDVGLCPEQAQAREYTIADFDVTPYLPADPNTALYKVLQQAELLTHKRQTDGVPYRQHDWSKGSDEANLTHGIDCSRALWFVFTRAGLPYTSRSWHQGFVSTAEMFDESQGSCNSALTPDSTLMKGNFESCLDEPLRTGDLLVWQGRRPTSGECIGHTVMVIDPEGFIGWGSHGWDGSKSDDGKKLNDTGVEYQRILAKTWAKWDRTEYELKACWRHKQFIAEAGRSATVEDLYLTGFDCEGKCGR